MIVGFIGQYVIGNIDLEGVTTGVSIGETHANSKRQYQTYIGIAVKATHDVGTSIDKSNYCFAAYRKKQSLAQLLVDY